MRPQVANTLTVTDFAQLIVSIDRYKADMRKVAGG